MGRESNRITDWYQLTVELLGSEEFGSLDAISFITTHRYTYRYYPSLGETLIDKDLFEDERIQDYTKLILELAIELNMEPNGPSVGQVHEWATELRDCVQDLWDAATRISDLRDGYTHEYDQEKIEDHIYSKDELVKGDYSLYTKKERT